MMSTFSVSSGLRLEPVVEQLVIVGRNKLLKALKYEGNLAQKLATAGIDYCVFKTAIERLKPNESLPLYLNSAKLVSVLDDVSRYNSPSNSHAIFKGIKGLIPENESKKLDIVLYAEYAHVLASFSAIIRCFPLYSAKTSAPKIFQQINIEIVVVDENKSLSKADINFLQDLGDSIRTCCKLVDMPPNELHTEAFADQAIALINKIDKSKVQTTLIKGEDLRTQGFGGIYHVGKAACNPPLFLCFSHMPNSAEKTYAFVGKGIVFDTGGMQIKSKTGMPSMKADMGGAAAVLSAFYSLVRAGFTQNLHCLLCVAENNISPVANKPDDIITLLSGKSIEINNTDAEGRLVLADGVFYAKTKLKATTIIDVATLTGAQHYASGKVHASILSNAENIETRFIAAGKKSGDLVHPLPFSPDLHLNDLKSVVADWKNANINPGSMEGPPSAVAGLFIGAQIDFGKSEGDQALTNWVHVDIASPATVGERATGFAVPLLCALLSNHITASIADL